METKKRISESGKMTIQGVEVNFNWDYEENKTPTRITAAANTENGMSCNFAFNITPENLPNAPITLDHMEIQIYGLKDEIPTTLLEGVKTEFETIKNSFNPQS